MSASIESGQDNGRGGGAMERAHPSKAECIEGAAGSLMESSDLIRRKQQLAQSQLLGWSPATCEIRRLVIDYADQPLPLVIAGEPGTGKRTVARALHRISSRSRAPYVSVPCESVDCEIEDFATLLENAGDGTLVLETIEVLPADLQRGLAQLLSHTATATKPPARIIATSRGGFDHLGPAHDVLPELWCRLGGLRISLTPLRDRPEDIAEITRVELERIAAERGAAPRQLSTEVLAVLEQNRWFGNVAELLFAVRLMACQADTDEPLDRFDAEAALHGARSRFSPRSRYDAKQRRQLIVALEQNDWNVSATARRLGVSRGWLRRRIELLELG